MKKQIKTNRPRSAFAPARASIPSVIIALALAAGASAQTPQPAGRSVLSALGLPDQLVQPTNPSFFQPSNLLFNVLHAYAPADICAAYGVDALHNAGWTGKGQTIVVVDSYGSPTALQDLQTFSTTFGLSAPDLTIIYPDGQPTLNSSDKMGWVGETSLDLQWAHAIAPDAKLVLIAANPAETDGVHGFPSMFKGIQFAITHYPGSAISQSFAATEQAFSGAADVQLARYEAIYQQALAAGCTPLAAAGDWGTANYTKQAGGNGNFGGASYYPYPTVNWPASSPSVTAVGGTWLQYHWRWDPQITFATYLTLAGWTVNPANSYNPLFESFLNWDATNDRVEVAWHEDWLDIFNDYNATGGGLSAFFPTPPWQAGLPSSLTRGARAVPDVSWNAALDGGVWVYESIPGNPYGGWAYFNGTSCATPQIAGLVALANQMRASLGKGPIGHLAPKLYQLPASDFNDIVPVTFASGANAFTVGDNTRYGTGVPGWPCTVGYDLTTGLGSPKAYSFVHDLATMFP
jgi:subtilase family serine protease